MSVVLVHIVVTLVKKLSFATTHVACDIFQLHMTCVVA
jgi:hypothetical protein